MKFEQVQQTLKNGKTVTIRQATMKDAEALLMAVSRYLGDSAHLVTMAEEFNPTIKDEKRWINVLNNNRNCLLLIATYEKKIIGNIDLKGEPRRKTSHNALLGIGIAKEWRRCGLGEILMRFAIDWALQSLTIETLWLHVFANHSAGISLYNKMGFSEVYRQKNFVKNLDGNYIDNIVMCLDVSTK